MSSLNEEVEYILSFEAVKSYIC